MKKLMIIAALVLGSNVASAAITCAITKESVKGSNTYDKSLFYGEVPSSQGLLFIIEENSVRLVDTNSPDSLKTERDLDKKHLVFLSKHTTEEEIFIGILKSKAANANSLEPLSVESITSFPLIKDRVIEYVTHGLTVMCFTR